MKKKQSDKRKHKIESSVSVRVPEPYSDQAVCGELELQLKIGRELMQEYRETLKLLAKM